MVLISPPDLLGQAEPVLQVAEQREGADRPGDVRRVPDRCSEEGATPLRLADLRMQVLGTEGDNLCHRSTLHTESAATSQPEAGQVDDRNVGRGVGQHEWAPSLATMRKPKLAMSDM